MKTIKIDGVDYKYAPKFKESMVSTIVDGKELNRLVTVCLIEEKAMEELYAYSVGIAIMNPDDEKGNFGEVISEGRALKKPLTNLRMTSCSKLPKAICNEILMWGTLHAKRNLNTYITKSRGSLK